MKFYTKFCFHVDLASFWGGFRHVLPSGQESSPQPDPPRPVGQPDPCASLVENQTLAKFKAIAFHYFSPGEISNETDNLEENFRD